MGWGKGLGLGRVGSAITEGLEWNVGIQLGVVLVGWHLPGPHRVPKPNNLSRLSLFLSVWGWGMGPGVWQVVAGMGKGLSGPGGGVVVGAGWGYGNGWGRVELVGSARGGVAGRTWGRALVGLPSWHGISGQSPGSVCLFLSHLVSPCPCPPVFSSLSRLPRNFG